MWYSKVAYIIDKVLTYISNVSLSFANVNESTNYLHVRITLEEPNVKHLLAHHSKKLIF